MDPLICSTCRSTLADHFRLSRVARDGTVGGNITVCSLLCLVKWAYAAGAQRATMGVMLARHTIGQVSNVVGQLVSSLRGEQPRSR